MRLINSTWLYDERVLDGPARHLARFQRLDAALQVEQVQLLLFLSKPQTCDHAAEGAAMLEVSARRHPRQAAFRRRDNLGFGERIQTPSAIRRIVRTGASVVIQVENPVCER